MKVRCPHCEQKYDLEEANFGQDLTCQICQGIMRFDVPAETEPSGKPESTKCRKMRVSSSGPQTKSTVPGPSRRKGLMFAMLAILIGAGFFVYSRFTTEQVAVADKKSHPAITSEVFTGFDDGGVLFKEKVKPFFEKHCIACHGPKKEKGSLRVDQLLADLDDHYSLSHFQNIIDELTTENMPPEDEPQPDAQEVVEVINVLTEYVNSGKKKHVAGGGRPVRRLTRTEFINTVWDQLGVHIDEEGLPVDLLVGSFDTNATTLYMTDMHIQAYLLKARSIARRFIASRSKKPGTYEVPVQYSPLLKKSVFGFVATDVPPAGSLTLQTSWWQRDASGNNQIVIGPTKGGVEYEVVGTSSSPQLIEITVSKPEKVINWEIKYSNIPSVNVIKGLTKAKLKALGRAKLNGNTLQKVQEALIKHPVILGKIKNIQRVSPQPYTFFAPFLKKGDKLRDSEAPMIIGKFVALMKRGHEVDSEFIKKLNKVFVHGRKMGLTFWQALEEPLAISMCAMDSIMHFENRDPAKEKRTVSGVELANRLSYTLWRSAPDTELIKLGKSGSLLDAQVKMQQVKRMMNDERSNRFLSDFTNQWLELQRQDEIAVEKQIYNKFDLGVKPAMKEESIQFLSHLVRKNLTLTNLIDSDFMVLNNTMARHYGIPGVHGSEFRVVSRTGRVEDSVRGGILTHAGILMQGGTGDRTSIVERGAFIGRKIIDRPPPDPPPNAGELPTGDADTAKMTGAELVKYHASKPQCANCHAGIDPLGMALEGFDAVGLPRSQETRLNPKLSSLNKRQRRNPANIAFKVPLETKGYLYDGQKFDGISELKRVLMTKKHDLAKGFIRALFAFANGRESNFADEAIIEGIAEKASKEHYPARSIVEEVLNSNAIMQY